MVLEKTLESPLECKEFQPVHSEGDQPWDSPGISLEGMMLKLKLQHFGLENSLNRGAGQAIVHDITESDMTVQFSLF